MEITWLGHGTFQFVLPHGETLLFDPWTDDNPAYPKDYEIKRCETMLISHGHFDHIHDAVPLAKNSIPEWLRSMRPATGSAEKALKTACP
jgi:L-ascorbate metabolism protein UlaG (beta-lactamase superfamily)